MTLDDTAIERLVQEARAGDAWAFGLLFDHYHLPVYRYIASRVHRPSDAEDLTQLVFVKALEALPRYEARGIPFGGWLFRLARNTVIEHVRTRHDHLDLESASRQPGVDAGPDVDNGHPSKDYPAPHPPPRAALSCGPARTRTDRRSAPDSRRRSGD